VSYRGQERAPPLCVCVSEGDQTLSTTPGMHPLHVRKALPDFIADNFLDGNWVSNGIRGAYYAPNLR